MEMDGASDNFADTKPLPKTVKAMGLVERTSIGQ